MKVKAVSTLIAIISIFFRNEILFADTIVEEIINSDTTWTASDSPYIIDNSTKVAEGITLKIEPGVVINGRFRKLLNNIYVSPSILVNGAVMASGSPDKSIKFNVNIRGENGANIQINNAEIYSGISSEYSTIKIEKSKLSGVSAKHSVIKISDSYVKDGDIDIDSPIGDWYIERNILDKSSINIDHGTDPIFGMVSGGIAIYNIYIVNNLFLNNIKNAIFISEPFGGLAPVILKNNTFANTSRTAIYYRGYFDDMIGHLDATNNYWGTTDASIIDLMIFDKKYVRGLATDVSYIPFLSSPHPDTPTHEKIITPIPQPNPEPTPQPNPEQNQVPSVSGCITINGVPTAQAKVVLTQKKKTICQVSPDHISPEQRARVVFPAMRGGLESG